MTKAEVDVCMKFGIFVHLKKSEFSEGKNQYLIRELNKLIPYKKAGEADKNFKYYAMLFSPDNFRGVEFTADINDLEIVEERTEFVAAQVNQRQIDYIKSVIKLRLENGESKTDILSSFNKLAESIKV